MRVEATPLEKTYFEVAQFRDYSLFRRGCQIIQRYKRELTLKLISRFSVFPQSFHMHAHRHTGYLLYSLSHIRPYRKAAD